jgi:hypothetical protein
VALHVVLFDDMLDAAAARAVTASLHTSDGGGTGADEVTGGTYARQSITWNPATGGVLDAASTFTFDVPGGFTVRWLGLWDASGTPVWCGSIKLSTEESYGAGGTYTVLLLRLTQSDVSPV